MELSQTKAARKKRQPRSQAADAFVLMAMTLTAVAIAIGLYLQFGLAFWLAVVAALSLYVGLLALHAVVRRSERVEGLTAEIERLETELRLAMAGGRFAGAQPRPGPPAPVRPAAQSAGGAAPSVAPVLPFSLSQPAVAAPSPSAGPTPPLHEPGFSGEAGWAHRAAPLPGEAQPQAASAPVAGLAQPVGAAPGEGGDRALPELKVEAIMSDYWAFRPAQPPRLPEGSATAAAPALAAPGTPAVKPAAGGGVDDIAEIPRAVAPPPLPAQPTAPPPLVSASPREADVEMIQGLIKKLADEVNAAEAGLLQRPARGAAAPPAAIEASVHALRTAADQMRASSAPPRHRGDAAQPDTAPREPRPAATDARSHDGGSPPDGPRRAVEVTATAPAATVLPPPLPAALPPRPAATVVADTAVLRPAPWPEATDEQEQPAPGQSSAASHSRLAALAEAITAGRLDVLLDPILGLADQRARHFEVSVRLRDKSGHVLEPPDSVPELRSSGLLPLLDCVRMQRSAQVAGRLADRGKPGSLFSTFSGESLAHDRFLSEFTDAYANREALATQLVLSFALSDVRAFSGRDWETLEEMRELGFRFALQSVTDLDLDFVALKAAGFDFVKLDATVFLEGMAAASGVVPAGDICRHLAKLGMALIVGHIEDEAQLARIFGFGVILGQGQLFGGARPMKAGALSDASGAAA